MLTLAHSPNRAFLPVVSLLTAAYLTGIIGLQIPAFATYFSLLTPLNLLASLALLLWFHTDWRPSFVAFIALAIFTGYGIEVLGVKTGLIFGQYEYGPGLGPRLWGVPPVIGLNWLILSYCCGSVCDRLPYSTAIKVVAAASLMTGLDFFIEPVAVTLDFWTWYGRPVPLQNYVGWWVVSAGLFTVWFWLPFRRYNRLAGWLLALQFLFFLGHGLIIHFTNR
jgi:uncharacterized membrane protein